MEQIADLPPRIGLPSPQFPSQPVMARRLSIGRSPAILVALMLAIGIAMCDRLPCIPRFWISAAALLLAAAIVIRRRPLIANLSLAMSILLIGLTAAQIERFEFPENHIANYTTSAERFAEVELNLDQTPRLLLSPPAEQRVLPPKQTLEAQVRAIRTREGWVTASGRLMVVVEEPNPRLRAGQIVRATGILERPATPMNPGEFDIAAYWRDQRNLASLRVAHADGVQILQEHSPGPIVWLREKTRHLLAEGFTPQQSFDHAMLRALVLGDPDPQLRDVQDELVQTGMVHQMSISGLHIAIIGGVVLMLCRLLRISPRVSVLLALCTVALYATVALPSWPGWRSVIMCGLASIGLLGRRWTGGLQLLAIAVSVILLIHPADLRSPGFQISFVAVLALLLFSHRAQSGLWNWWRGPDAIALARGPANQTPRGPLAAGGYWALRFVLASLVAGLVAWIASMPLVAYRYGQLNTWSVPASIAMLPLTFVALVGGVMKILLTFCVPAASGALAVAASWPVNAMRGAVHAMDHLPGAALPMAAPPVAMLIAYYGLLAVSLVRFNGPRLLWLRRLAPIAACAGFVIFSIGGQPIAQLSSQRGLRITLISLGAGQCAVVRPSSSHAVLLDDGSSSVSDVGRRLIEPFLRDQGVSRIDQIVLSHGDFDHISATAELLRAYRQPPVYMSPHFQRNASGNFVAEGLLAQLAATRSPPRLIHSGDHLDLGDGVSIDVLWPPADCTMNSNNCGLVLKLKFAGRTALFPADIQEPAERELLKNPTELKADILIAPHHGSAEITTSEFIRAVHPQIILASNANRLTHKQKTFDALAGEFPLYRTNREGAITISIDAQGKIDVATFLNIPPQKPGISSVPMAQSVGSRKR